MEISEREKLINLRRLVVMFLLTTAFFDFENKSFN